MNFPYISGEKKAKQILLTGSEIVKCDKYEK